MNYTVHEENGFKFVEEGEGEVLLLLHGLFGALSNFQGIIDGFKDRYKVVVPLLPILELPRVEVSVMRFQEHVYHFMQQRGYEKAHLMGNSLGGHIALLFVLEHPELVKSLTLTGSSGLFENAMGASFPQRQSYEFIKAKTEFTFYDPKTASKELVDEVYEIVNDRAKAINIIATAKSAIRHNLGDRLTEIKQPTLLVWGMQDNITPDFVGEEFHKRLPNSKLIFIDKCGHAPMMEHKEEFNRHLSAFLEEVNSTV